MFWSGQGPVRHKSPPAPLVGPVVEPEPRVFWGPLLSQHTRALYQDGLVFGGPAQGQHHFECHGNGLGGYRACVREAARASKQDRIAKTQGPPTSFQNVSQDLAMMTLVCCGMAGGWGGGGSAERVACPSKILSGWPAKKAACLNTTYQRLVFHFSAS